MTKTINVDQVLHGYANGHQLLSASCEMSIDDRNRMDELSDLNGHCDAQEFIDYFTGYPIDNGRKYVLAKTWYAYEMKRPGCVWTHSLIFDTQDIGKLSDIAELMKLFKRPTEAVRYSDYNSKIIIESDEQKILPKYDVDKLQYVIYTVFLSEAPKYIVLNGQDESLDEELFIMLNCVPYEIVRTFTFSTMSYDIRKFDGNEFQYQITSEKNIFRFRKEACVNITSIKKYPYWVTCYVQDLQKNKLGNLHQFIMQYGEQYVNVKDYNCLGRLYYASLSGLNISLKEYFDFIEAVMPLKMDIYQKTIEHILDDDFVINIFQNQIYQILEMADMGKFYLKEEYKDILEKKIIEKNSEKLYPILKKYICGKLKENEKNLIEGIIKKLEPVHLATVSRMDENICVVLVRINSQLLLCREIWMQPKNFQCAILYSGGKNLPEKTIEKIIRDIIIYGTENIADDVYRFYGDRVLRVFYKLLDKNTSFVEQKIVFWMSILLKNQILLLNNIEKIPNRRYRQELFLKIDLGDIDLETVEQKTWEGLFYDLIAEEQDLQKIENCALQFILVIFSTKYRFNDEVIRKVVAPIYQKVKRNELDFCDWNRFQHCLPEVDACYSWDKCLRIRQALKEREYDITLLEK